MIYYKGESNITITTEDIFNYAHESKQLYSLILIGKLIVGNSYCKHVNLDADWPIIGLAYQVTKTSTHTFNLECIDTKDFYLLRMGRWRFIAPKTLLGLYLYNEYKRI